ncbi:MAG: FG-GAP repeat domain-containing protein [Acidobacteriaceae bacterium]
MKAALGPSFFLIVLLLIASGFAEAQHSRILPGTRQIALRQLSDGLGWKQPMYYSTIQTADIDGDGQSEVIARWIDGLNIYRLQNGTLIRHSRIPALSDNGGFYRPSWYSTIRTGVLDRKLGQADVIAREHDGIHVFRYDRKKHVWRELGSHVSVRPFADQDSSGTDWTKPKHYSTIQLADLTGNGTSELVGRGHNGLQVWRWDPDGESWAQLSAGGELGDEQGFDKEPYYYSLKLVDVDRDGSAELVARAPAGVQTYKWNGKGWTLISASGPFGDDAGFLADKRYKSVRASVDATGQAWLYGLAAGTGGAGSGAIQVHRWKKDRWQFVKTIPLPGSGWDRESQSATLMAADIQGDAQPEFLVRGPGGLHAYTLEGRPLPMHSRSFTDAQGWNLTEQYGTLQTASARVTNRGDRRLRTLIVGRGTKGLEVYKFTNQWTAAADSNFPQYCANFTTDSSPKCLAYKAISNACLDGVSDIRSQYTQASNTTATFTGFQNTVRSMQNPIGANNQATWVAVQSEMVQELGYAKTVLSWYTNNTTLLNIQYNDISTLLGACVGDVDLATDDSVVAKWLEFTGDVTSGVAGFFDGGQSASLIIAILEDTYKDLVPPTGDINEAISKIDTELNSQITAYPGAISHQQTAYLTDYSKLQQIGRDAATGGFDWAGATSDQVTGAAKGARNGMRINFYRTLLPSKWQVYWCDANAPWGGPDCASYYTKAKYNCLYGQIPGLGGYSSNAYIYAGEFHSVNWDLLGRITGVGPGTDPNGPNLNAIWYMMLLGGDLGWDLPQYGSLDDRGPNVHTSDPNLAYDQIKYGYHGPSSSCSGNGSFNGILSSNQTPSERLSVAQQNSKRITASEAKEILEEIRALKDEVEDASPDRDVEIGLTSPLREATRLIERAQLQNTPGQKASVSATTPAHLTELFIRRAQFHTRELGERQAQHLTAQAYCLIGELEGQSESCQSSGSRQTY